jgi:hypothetical protein
MSFDDRDNIRGLIDEEDPFAPDDDESDVVIESSSASDSLFMGMTPVERMFISMFLFMNVAVLGVALLLATGRIG